MQASAKQLGIPSSDMECLELTYLRSGITVSELATAKGVTVGAISQALNRLEKSQLARREADPADRRRTIVRLEPKALHRIAPVYEGITKAASKLLSLHSDRDLAAAREIIANLTVANSET